MAYEPQHICAGISYDDIGSDLYYELNSGETTPKDFREFLHADLDEYLDHGGERQRTGLFYVGMLPIDDADDTEPALEEAKEQIWKSKCLEEVEKNVDLRFTIEGLEEELEELEEELDELKKSVSDWKSSYEELRYQDTLLEKELNELEQSVSDWKRRYEELDLQHQDTLRDLFDATNGE